jgi:hypothetical protein
VREFAKGQFRLRDAPAPLRTIYGGFLVLTALGLASQLGFQIGRIGLSPAAIALYYRGSDRGDILAFPKTLGQLLEITHAHAFIMAMVVLVLAHLFVSTGVAMALKFWIIALALIGTIVDVLAPWGVRYVSATVAWLDLACWIAGAVSTWTMTLVAGWECLGRRAGHRRPV